MRSNTLTRVSNNPGAVHSDCPKMKNRLHSIQCTYCASPLAQTASGFRARASNIMISVHTSMEGSAKLIRYPQ